MPPFLKNTPLVLSLLSFLLIGLKKKNCLSKTFSNTISEGPSTLQTSKISKTSAFYNSIPTTPSKSNKSPLNSSSKSPSIKKSSSTSFPPTPRFPNHPKNNYSKSTLCSQTTPTKMSTMKPKTSNLIAASIKFNTKSTKKPSLTNFSTSAKSIKSKLTHDPTPYHFLFDFLIFSDNSFFKNLNTYFLLIKTKEQCISKI